MKHITITVGRISDMILRGGEEQRMVANLSPPLFLKKKSYEKYMEGIEASLHNAQNCDF